MIVIKSKKDIPYDFFQTFDTKTKLDFLRNKLHISVPAGLVIKARVQMLEYLDSSTSGLYVVCPQDSQSPSRYNHFSIMFEKEQDLVAFKLMFEGC